MVAVASSVTGPVAAPVVDDESRRVDGVAVVLADPDPPHAARADADRNSTSNGSDVRGMRDIGER
jgi:hypothetical protein